MFILVSFLLLQSVKVFSNFLLDYDFRFDTDLTPRFRKAERPSPKGQYQ